MGEFWLISCYNSNLGTFYTPMLGLMFRKMINFPKTDLYTHIHTSIYIYIYKS